LELFTVAVFEIHVCKEIEKIITTKDFI